MTSSPPWLPPTFQYIGRSATKALPSVVCTVVDIECVAFSETVRSIRCCTRLTDIVGTTHCSGCPVESSVEMVEVEEHFALGYDVCSGVGRDLRRDTLRERT